MPLSTGGAISATRRRAAQEFIAARENRINLTRNTITNTRSLHMTVVSDVSRIAARKQSIVSSSSSLDATTAEVSWSPPTWDWFLQEAPDFDVLFWSDDPRGEENLTTVPTTNGVSFYRLITP